MNKLLIGLMFLLVSCQQNSAEKAPATAGRMKVDSVLLRTQKDSIAKAEEKTIELGKYKTYWGYRFQIEGDFNGDGKQETLSEKLISTKTGNEIGKYCGLEKDTAPDCWWTQRVNDFRKPKCKLHCSNTAIKDFEANSPLTVGIDFLQNVGDLNEDGSDEIAFIENSGGCNTSLRTVRLATYKKEKWEFLASADTYADFFSWDTRIATAEDLKKPIASNIEKERAGMPPFFKKEKDKVVYEDIEAGTQVTKRMKIDW